MQKIKMLFSLLTICLFNLALGEDKSASKASDQHPKDQSKTVDTTIATKIPTKKASSFPDTVKDPQVGEVIVKCAGIVKKGMNHCGANGHACSGLSSEDPKIKDFDPNEWIYVRKEVCDATPGKVVGSKQVTAG